jgi:hypothetical protein
VSTSVPTCTSVPTYTDFMVVGIDYGILCCDRCGALVPFDRRNAHDTFHVTVDSSAESCA